MYFWKNRPVSLRISPPAWAVCQVRPHYESKGLFVYDISRLIAPNSSYIRYLAPLYPAVKADCGSHVDMAYQSGWVLGNRLQTEVRRRKRPNPFVEMEGNCLLLGGNQMNTTTTAGVNEIFKAEIARYAQECYAMPYGAIGWGLHALPAYTFLCTWLGIKAMCPWKRIKYSGSTIVISLISFILTLATTVTTSAKCSDSAALILIALSKCSTTTLNAMAELYVGGKCWRKERAERKAREARARRRDRESRAERGEKERRERRGRAHSESRRPNLLSPWYLVAYIPGMILGAIGGGSLTAGYFRPGDDNLFRLTLAMQTILVCVVLLLMVPFFIRGMNSEASWGSSVDNRWMGFLSCILVASSFQSYYSDWIIAFITRDTYGTRQMGSGSPIWGKVVFLGYAVGSQMIGPIFDLHLTMEEPEGIQSVMGKVKARQPQDDEERGKERVVSGDSQGLPAVAEGVGVYGSRLGSAPSTATPEIAPASTDIPAVHRFAVSIRNRRCKTRLYPVLHYTADGHWAALWPRPQPTPSNLFQKRSSATASHTAHWDSPLTFSLITPSYASALGGIGLLISTLLSIVTIVRCKNSWELLVIGVWKMAMSLLNGITAIHVAVMVILKKRKMKRARRREASGSSSDGGDEVQVEKGEEIPGNVRNEPGAGDHDEGDRDRDVEAEMPIKVVLNPMRWVSWWVVLYIPGMFAGVVGLMALVVKDHKVHPGVLKLTAGFYTVVGAGVLVVAAGVLYRLRNAEDGPTARRLVFGGLIWMVGTFSVLAVFYSDWALGTGHDD
ncbi:hypothetical protein NMY22_g15435 [Coprinellus aureogranulatus]|nr:hypothetical protein NMY22_g15435 [Coprinellus aureogranulatus]